MRKRIFLLLLLYPWGTSLLCAQETKGAAPTSNFKLPTSNSTRAVVVGISDYQDPAIPDLRFADRDAEAFANFLRSPAGGALDEDHLKMLINKEATMAQFAIALDWLVENSKEGDLALIYFSGHGDVEKKTLTQPGFLLCWDAPAQVYMAGGAFALPMLQEVISTLSVQNKAKVVVIADACRSGKLSGSSIGGAQATAANLSKQYANEIKILSCQPNEYSLEGEQWGGGRGVFSYHLVNALYGLADHDADDRVTLRETDRYLEDRVPPEAAPERQNPVVLGDKESRLANVTPEMLAAVRKSLGHQMPAFAPVDNRGLEDEVLAGADSSIRELYRLFKQALQDKVFLAPADSCVEAYYLRLIAEPKLARLHNTMRRNYAAALQDDAQQAVNNLMKMEKTEVRLYRLERLKKYAPYPRYLERAAELLGERHYMYPVLQARKCYFEGRVLQMASPVNADSALGQRILAKYRESLQWQPDVALTYYAIGSVFEAIIPQADSMLWYAEKAIDLTPGWIRAYTVTAVSMILTFRRYDDAKRLSERAIQLDSTSCYAWDALGVWYQYARGDWPASEKCYLKSGALDSTFSWPWMRLGQQYFDLNQNDKARLAFEKAAQTEKPNPFIFTSLGALHYNEGQYAEAEPYLNKALEIEPADVNNLRVLASVYFKTGRPEKAGLLLRQAMAHDSSSRTFQLIGEIYADNGDYETAERHFKRAILLDSTDSGAWSFLGWLYQLEGRHKEAIPIIKKSIELDPNWLITWYELGQAYQHTGNKQEALNTYRQVLERSPDSSFGFLGLASLAAAEGKASEAIQFLEQAAQKGCTFTQMNAPEFRALDGFEALVKKYFPARAGN